MQFGAIRAVPLTLLSVAKSGSRAGDTLASEWAEKLRRYTRVTEIQLKPNPLNAKNPDIAKQHEGERVLKAISAEQRLIVLDERGRDLRSEDMAQLLATASEEGWKEAVFAIGGPYGHSKEVRERADDVIRLSSLVLNHEIARIVLLEQLYRAWTICRGERRVYGCTLCDLMLGFWYCRWARLTEFVAAADPCVLLPYMHMRDRYHH
jgi:23S rRNA (pseudouridine1915-N3)-methyltransferase